MIFCMQIFKLYIHQTQVWLKCDSSLTQNLTQVGLKFDSSLNIILRVCGFGTATISCIIHAWSMHVPYLIHAQTMHDPCMIHAWSMHDLCKTHAWSMHDSCVIHAWSTHDSYTIYAWSMHDLFMIHAWSMYNPCMIYQIQLRYFIHSIDRYTTSLRFRVSTKWSTWIIYQRYVRIQLSGIIAINYM